MRAGTTSQFELLSDTAREFMARRTAEFGGVCLLAATGALSVALASWSVADPSWTHAAEGPVRNLLGFPGAIAADMLMQLLGLAVVAVVTPLACWGWNLMTRRRLEHARFRVLLLATGGLAATGLAGLLPVPDRWPLPTGLGGVIGDAVNGLPARFLHHSEAMTVVSAVVLAGIAILSLTASAGFGLRETADEDDLPQAWEPNHRSTQRPDIDAAGEPGLALMSLGAVVQGALVIRSAASRIIRRRNTPAGERAAPWLPPEDRGPDRASEPALRRPAAAPVQEARVEPSFDGLIKPSSPKQPDRVVPTAAPAPSRSIPAADDPRAPRAVRVLSQAEAPRPAKPASPGDDLDYALPPITMLAEPRRLQGSTVTEDALEQNARLLEGVLDDFGVRGEIINVRPGPVVTLYELEPAPGIKSSRVIGLADDIARSMSALSARVAVVQGRNVIGIELPNQRRETVFLRELIGSAEFTDSKHRLSIALGKTIGGEPVIVDLARMPHLLVAGTTGSGKSVAINTMILSLLYRMKPEECRLIMVDPKMLELSIYDGIPHLLTPVVTDPKKAVVALKWAVREMEDRYKKMSKVGVRNIDGFNARIAEAQAAGEAITRTVQTGYDKETGEAIYEHEAMDLATLPYIVVIVDEMADLMMVAGKEIEGAIQRLAQMARAAGIHLIMATQRPSVDVITGTIKANFPTRISFQVTSKIDSRTILGEQGAEQLLGQGDMLHMAGGGRISRVHGPFVSDGEVERIVNHLKAQGRPDYLDVVTADEGEEAGEDGDEQAVFDKGSFGEESGDLYDQAVRVVLRDKKCSTSYIQRRLQVGYNKAASLVERMEREGLVGPANPTGKREILMEDQRGGREFDDED